MREEEYASLLYFSHLEEVMGQLERDFQPKLIQAIKERFPGCIVIKNDPTYIQGFPDLTVFYKNRWAAVETKRSASSPKRPNQEYYISLLNSMSYASFVCPENLEEVLNDIQRAFESDR